MPYRRGYRRNYRGQKNMFAPKRKTKIEKVRKMVGTEPETLVDKIGKGVGTVATIARTVSGIVSMINVEDKYVDTAISVDLSVGTPTNAVTLNAIAQGADYNQRNGNKVLDKCLQVNLRAFLDPTATALATNMVRVVILLDKKPQIGALTWAVVYEPDTVTGLIDKNTAGDRVVVLFDKKIVFNGGNTRYVYKKFYHNLDRIHTQYTGSTATAFESGQIYMLFCSDLAGAQPNIAIRGSARFCYQDN